MEKGKVRSRIKIYLRISLSRMVVARGQRVEEMLVTGHKLPVVRGVSSEDIKCSIVTVVTTSVSYT